MEKKLAFTQPLPVTHLISFFVTTFLTGTCIYLFQEILSFFFDNQIIPLAIGLIGSFFGLFSLFFSETFAQFVIWSYFCQLATVHINWDPAARTVSYLESTALHRSSARCPDPACSGMYHRNRFIERKDV